MQSKDLRIGNYVNYIGGGTFKVTGIHEFGLDVEDDIESTYMEYEYFEPIKLTEDWMINFGMEYTDGFSNSRKLYVKKHEHDVSHITYSEKEGMLRLSNGQQKGTTLIPHIKYVHQLQNLYFALTGEELELKSESKP
jgi:hypothetical protein